MNFFDAQDRARRATRRLVIAYVLATILIVAGVTLVFAGALFFTRIDYGMRFTDVLVYNAPILAGIAVITTLVIVGATLFKTAVLASGGGKVAQELGGTLVEPDVQDPLRRRLRNVVEEMAIASGVPVPEIYVLEQETGINAFAAGYAPEDAAVAVTRGALEVLDREELQGVIAHEFSHVLNGDMRLNIRLMGVLFGIMVLGLFGRTILRSGRFGAFTSNRRGRGGAAILVIGLGLAVLGAIGVFFARVIKASVSRQREYLADASAVQFTRQTDGIAGALKKIGGYDAGSYIQATDPEEVSHMLFGTGTRLFGLFATHPPLTERIQALDPNFTPGDYPEVDPRRRPVAADDDEAHPAAAGFAAVAAGGAVADAVGQIDPQQVAYASRLRKTMPAMLYDAAHSPELSYLLAIALVVERSGRSTDRQLVFVNEQLGDERSRLVRELHAELARLGPEYRLPLLEIAFPALRRRPRPQLDYLVDLARRMIELDGEIDLYEFCFYRLLTTAIRNGWQPLSRPRKRNRAEVRNAALGLLRAIAHYGHEDAAAAEAAFEAGRARFGDWAGEVAYSDGAAVDVPTLERQLDILQALNADGRRMLVNGVGAVVMADNHVAVAEAELLRAICATLDCPLPPIVTGFHGADDS